MSGRAQLPVGLLVGAMLDAIVPDPRVGHPVAGFGAVATAVEGRIYADSRVRGLLFAAGCVAATAATGAAIERRAGRYTGAAAIAAGTWTVLGARSLRHEARAVHELLTRGDLDGARARVTHLVGRDPSVLDADGVARAAVESVAENSCDAVVAPLLWGAIGGLPGLLGYRAINTLDAMVGHRTPRYANFGWAAARLDDIANVVPARVTALLVALAAPAVGGDGRAALRTALRDGRRHPSPNSGFSEAAYAGALALRLGGPNVYAGGTEDRPHLGDGAAPTPADVPRAARLCAAVTASAALFAAGVAVARSRGGARPRRPAAKRRPVARRRPAAKRRRAPGRPVRGGLLVAGTTSDAGKSVLTAGLCRWLARQGVRVAPFKAQNMSLNSAVTKDGAEIGRAQAMQAQACGIEPEAAMNPVLLKPGSDTHSQVVLLGKPIAEVGALDYGHLRPRLHSAVLEALADLRARFDVVICEGAGSPAEINLRDRDLANMELARSAQLPVIVVGDIDRGGVLAALFGTLAVLAPADQRLIAAFVVNKFRGDERLLAPGLAMLQDLTGRPTLGVLPWRSGLWLDAEDSLDLDSRPQVPLPPLAADSLRIAVVRLPHVSNVTDFDALAAEPGVDVRLVSTPGAAAEADLVIIPGTRATVSDLDWLRRERLAEAIAARAAAGRPVLGICGGFQMLAGSIVDDVESRRGHVEGLGLLPAVVEFSPQKVLARRTGTAFGEVVDGYLIHQGRVRVDGGEPFLDGCSSGSVSGTTWHGIFENDAFRRAFLRDLAARTDRDFAGSPDISFASVREQRFDVLADLVEAHLDTHALSALIEHGPPNRLPIVTSLLK